MNLKTFEKGFHTDYSNMGGYTIGIDMGQDSNKIRVGGEEVKEAWFTSTLNFLARCRSFLGFK